MTKLKYSPAEDVERLARDIVAKLEMNWIDTRRVKFLRSNGSRGSAVARIYGLPRVFQVAYGVPPLYVVEIVSEKFDKMNFREKVEVVVHELLHIPKSFSGGLRPHRGYVDEQVVHELTEKYLALIGR